MAAGVEDLFLLSDDFDDLLGILAEDEALEEQFTEVASNTQKETITCEDCGKVYKTREGYNRHRSAKHTRTADAQQEIQPFTVSLLASSVASAIHSIEKANV